MALTPEELNVLRALEQRIDTVASVVCRLAERAFNDDDRVNIPGLNEALEDCHHELRVVQGLDRALEG